MVRNSVIRLAVGGALCAFLSGSAFAQYGGGGGTTSGMGGYTPPKGGYSSTTGIAIGAGAAAGVALAYLALRKSSVVGCIEPSSDGIKLMNEKDKKVYSLIDGSGDLKPGERVALRGKRAKDNTGNLVFRVQKLAKDYGLCNPESASKADSASHQ